MSLTNRTRNWLEWSGIHIAAADENSIPFIAVSDEVETDGDIINAVLSDEAIERIRPAVESEKTIAVAPGSLGSIRLPYQFKGTGRIDGNRLSIEVNEIYCTKPGPEAGIRVDVLGDEGARQFDESRWQDLPPERS